MSTTDRLEPSGPNTSLRPSRRPTVYRPAPGASPHRLRRGDDGQVYGWVRMVPDEEADPPDTPTGHQPGRTGTTSPHASRGGAGLDTPSHERTSPRPHAVRDLQGYDNRPNPLTATTPEEFVARMRDFRAWSGAWSYRELEQFSGGWVSRSNFHATLTGSQLPKYMVLCAFISACGGDEHELQRWVTAWRRLRMSPDGEADPTLHLVHSAEAETARQERAE